MVRAYVSILTEAGTSPDVIEHLRDLESVRQADIVAGEFDIVAEIEAESERGLLSLVTEDIRPCDGVGQTRTYIVLD
jgi:DNA-binding Lrp family transcriptional regulator